MSEKIDAQAASGANGRVTVYDVAAEAGTSVSTVSRVLNGSSLAAEETRRAVLAAAERLGYTQRRVRRSAARSVLNIAVFLPQAAEPHAHLFYDAAALFTGIQSGLGSVRAHTIAALNGSTSPFEGKKLGDVDGCIFAFSSPPHDVREMLLEREIPTVVLNRLDDDFACVVNDFTHGMRALSEQVVQRRSRPRAAYVTVETARPVADYRWEALASHEPALTGERDRYEYASIGAISPQAVRSLLNAGYETFVCVNDLVAVAVHDRLATLGVNVPGEVGVTGYDAAPVRGLISCEITSVDLAVEKLGHEAAERLVRAVLGRTVPTGRVMIPGELIPGASL